MLPGSLGAGRDASPRAVRRDLSLRSTHRTSVLLAAVRRVLRVLSVWQKHAAGRSVLASLDDRLLRDMGLTRTDVGQDLMKPFWRA